jgi:Mrp family chromosome partitioning ATPase
MIVEKAVNMAKMMNIPVLGIVENMSWIACPDCGKKIFPFGESQTAKIAMAQGIPLLAQLPVDPAVARECDTGVIELFNEDWMDAVVRAVEDCPHREQK